MIEVAFDWAARFLKDPDVQAPLAGIFEVHILCNLVHNDTNNKSPCGGDFKQKATKSTIHETFKRRQADDTITISE